MQNLKEFVGKIVAVVAVVDGDRFSTPNQQDVFVGILYPVREWFEVYGKNGTYSIHERNYLDYDGEYSGKYLVEDVKALIVVRKYPLR